MINDTFYITTPIYYVNDKPHIGHAYTTILADVLARYQRESRKDVLFLTGLDEHGQKVQEAALQRKLLPQDHCDELAPRFINLWEKLGIGYTDFIRTTQKRHVDIVRAVLQAVYDKGDIYKDEYEGWYSISEERFITETEKESGTFRDIKKIKESNWFFRMGKYQDQLIEYINSHPDFIQPVHRKNEILGFLKKPLADLCISRPKSRMSWGIEIPFDSDYVTYVWFDALLNYISTPGYGSDNNKFNKWWPADVHLIGKDILTTHAVYWPTMLFSMGLMLPKTIFAHGWWLTGQEKMSKSLGNIVNPLDLIDQYGVDAVRYYLMSEMVLGQDAHFTLASFIKRYNSDLANDYGNLLNRVSGLIQKYFDGVIPDISELTEADLKIKEAVDVLNVKVKKLIEGFCVHEAINEVLSLVRQLNKYLEHQSPWKLAKTDLKAAGQILYVALEGLRVSTIYLKSVMPEKTKEVLTIVDALGSNASWGQLKSGVVLKEHGALFPRLEIEE